EPIPISSSGHLVILREIFNINIHGLSFEILVNFGSLIAVILVYKKDITQIIKNGCYFLLKRNATFKKDFQYMLYLLTATFITGVIGLLFEDFINSRLTATIFVGFTLL